EKQDWVSRQGYQGPWREAMRTMNSHDRNTFLKHFNRCREEQLDTHYGACELRIPENARLVADSLLFFDGKRYEMGDFVIMPNHVHLLAMFPRPEEMKKTFDSWLHYTAVRINRRTGRKGKLWQQEPFDHLVRSVEQYDYLRKYIADNPLKAGLRAGEFLYRCLEE
ncbi:MAG: transposase, partial [Planctomycetales bacterium]|nr:transposase [Planctomycetales bacterium]